MGFKFFSISFVLVFLFFLSPLFSQSEESFLDDFGGDEFSDIEAEIDFTQNETFNPSIQSEETEQSGFSNKVIISQKLIYGLDKPESPF